MKKTLLALTSCILTTTLVAQELNLTTQISSTQASLSQQLIGYAIEVSTTVLEEKRPVGRYTCDKIYSLEGYSILFGYPCEVIVHSDKGPIVVRYKEVPPETDQEIRTFLIEHGMNETVNYNNGRFRFSLTEEDISRQARPASNAVLR